MLCSRPAKPPISQTTEPVDKSNQPAVSLESRDDHGSQDDREEGEAEEDEDLGPLEPPPLPLEAPPVLPTETLSAQQEDDGWEPIWDESAQAFYFHNKITQASQWENPRVPQVVSLASKTVPSRAKDTGPPGADLAGLPKKPLSGGYDPAIHGDYDPTADYAKAYDARDELAAAGTTAVDTPVYAATGAFNRFTGKWQNADINPEKFSDENKSRRQMNAFFDVDAAANAHNGKSLKAERSSKKLSKEELKAFKEKRRERKEEKRRAWLRD